LELVPTATQRLLLLSRQLMIAREAPEKAAAVADRSCQPLMGPISPCRNRIRSAS
jgi:hypothetical protein